MDDHLRIIMSSVFNIPFENINEKTSVENCEQWDSLHHMSLLLAIEEEFEINLADDDVLNMKDFASIIGILESKN